MSSDLFIIGGGVVGLSVADEATRRGLRVTIADQGDFGREASWAGAGMLTCRPRARQTPGKTDYHDLKLMSVQLHAEWARRIQEETGIDVGYRVCGALELAFNRPDAEADVARLKELTRSCNDRGVKAVWREASELKSLEANIGDAFAGAMELPGEAQVRNPRLCRGLVESIRKRGATLLPHTTVADVLVDQERVRAVRLTNGEEISVPRVVLSSGAWTGQFIRRSAFAARLKEAVSIEPVRGQLLRYQVAPDFARRLLTVGNHYIVPRGDDVLLVGATHEKAGFEKAITDEGRASLKEFAEKLLPGLSQQPIVQQWAGLRPGLKGRHPLIGHVEGLSGLYLNVGHYRNGLTLAPASAELLVDSILAKESRIDRSVFLPL
jgi:glycine oxidase